MCVHVCVCASHLPHELCVHLGHTINGAGSLHAEFRSGVPGGGGPEGPDGAGDKHTQVVLQGHVQDVVEPWGRIMG